MDTRAPGLHVAAVTEGRTCTLTLTGVLDAGTAGLVRVLAAAGPVTAARFVTVDLARVGFVDVAGWHALRDLDAALSEGGLVVTQVGRRRSLDRLDGVLLGLDACRRHPSRPACASAA